MRQEAPDSIRLWVVVVINPNRSLKRIKEPHLQRETEPFKTDASAASNGKATTTPCISCDKLGVLSSNQNLHTSMESLSRVPGEDKPEVTLQPQKRLGIALCPANEVKEPRAAAG
ncbi:hypothetical protein Tco_0289876 [Tanacetum coccineum]